MCCADFCCFASHPLTPCAPLDRLLCVLCQAPTKGFSAAAAFVAAEEKAVHDCTFQDIVVELPDYLVHRSAVVMRESFYHIVINVYVQGMVRSIQLWLGCPVSPWHAHAWVAEMESDLTAVLVLGGLNHSVDRSSPSWISSVPSTRLLAGLPAKMGHATAQVVRRCD